MNYVTMHRLLKLVTAQQPKRALRGLRKVSALDAACRFTNAREMALMCRDWAKGDVSTATAEASLTQARRWAASAREEWADIRKWLLS